MVLTWGIAAAGKITHDFVTAIGTIPRNKHKIVAIADPELERAEDFSILHNIGKCYDSFEKLAQDSDICVVYIGTLNPFHFSVTKLMLENGKNVLCEKPICLNSKEVQELYDIAKNKNLFLMEAMWSRFFPSYKHLCKIIDTIGDVKEIRVKHGFKALDVERIRTRKLGGGITLDIGLYAIQLAQMFFNQYPDKIAATGILSNDGVDVESEFILLYKNKGKVYAKISALENFDNQATIKGSKGEILLRNYWCCTSLTDATGSVVEWPLPAGKFEFNHTNACGLRYEAEEVYNCLKNALIESPLYTHQNSIEMIKILDEIRSQLSVRYDIIE